MGFISKLILIPAYIKRIIAWAIWFPFTAFYMYPKYFKRGDTGMLQNIIDWVTNNGDTIIIAVWVIVTFIMVIDLIGPKGENKTFRKKD